MNYQETTAYLFSVTPVFEKVGASAYKEGLDNSLALDEHFGHPHRQFKSIHVAGTNGKGSCSHTIAAVLQAAGYRVGLYTSPHLVDFRERIRVNGECIPEQYVIDFVEQERHFFEPLHPSFFELTTAMAFKYFAEQQVDYAVVEVGLGGRLDCTNIITPVLSVITNISLDHTQFLGDTLERIAAEKAGIIKAGVPVVVGETVPETRPVFAVKAHEMRAPIYFAEEFDATPFDDIEFELKGDYQQKNRRTILCALDTLTNYELRRTKFDVSLREVSIDELRRTKFDVSLRESQVLKEDVLQPSKLPTSEGTHRTSTLNLPTSELHPSEGTHRTSTLNLQTSIRNGFAHVSELTGLVGRWQKIQQQPLVICDTGHNVGGWQYLAPQIAAQPCKQLRIVFGMVDDKDIDTVMALLPKQAVYYWTQASTHRAIPVGTVCQKGLSHGLQGSCYSSVSDAYRHALQEADTADFIFVGGSSYVVADLLASLS